ncbi:uncharacterized protein LOC133178586 isoform X2 [Saccostrea echinata]|uniref:uncharacterized protein LOC133178586 isoform X2 n=1 Tax=Saccostrea echinata TaxID=191078 RepID=UPI002A8183A7|nr:uncharacterized protein LOC133178586 isoform X2 [Saccostrea echinata]
MEQGQQCANPLQNEEVLESQYYRQSITENKARQGRRNLNCSVLGNTVMVSSANENVCRSAHKDSEQHTDIEVTESLVCISSPSQQAPPSRLSCVRQIYEGRGLSEESVSIIMKSWRSSTHKQYGIYINKWFQFIDGKVDRTDKVSVNLLI